MLREAVLTHVRTRDRDRPPVVPSHCAEVRLEGRGPGRGAGAGSVRIQTGWSDTERVVLRGRERG